MVSTRSERCLLVTCGIIVHHNILDQMIMFRPQKHSLVIVKVNLLVSYHSEMDNQIKFLLFFT